MSFYEQLNRVLPGKIESDCTLGEISYWKIGGKIKYVARPESISQLRGLLALLTRTGYPYLIIGKSTNILFTDDVISAVLIILGESFATVTIDNKKGRVVAGAGAWMPLVARRIGSAGLSGAEHLVGIPGSVGGIVAMNGGSNRQSISENLLEVRSMKSDGTIITRTADNCAFGYRESCFQDNDEVVLNVVLECQPGGDVLSIKRKMLGILKSRREKFPLSLPSCGSIFMADPSKFDELGPPGKILEELGLKGTLIGGACISEIHANFVVNKGGATAQDVLALVKLAMSRVFIEYPDYKMKSEIKFVNDKAEVIPLHIAATQMG